MFVSRLLKRKEERATAREALKDLWFIDIDRKNNQFIRSMTINNPKITLKVSKNEESSILNIPSLVLTRNNTTTLPNEGKQT